MIHQVNTKYQDLTLCSLCYQILTMPYLSPNSFNKRTDADDNRQDKPGASNSPSTLYGDSYLSYKYSSNHLILIAVKAFNESPQKITQNFFF